MARKTLTDAPALLDARRRSAFVVGAAGGVGSAVIELFRAAGARVAAADLDGTDLPAQSDGLLPLTLDATDEAQVKAAVSAAADAFGTLDYVVNAAGAAGFGPLHEVSLADWRHIMNVNLTSAFLIARAAYPHMTRPGGALALISSTNGRTGGTVYSGPAYGAAKAGIISLVRYLAMEWAADGMRVNAVAPGPVETPMLDRLAVADRDTLKAEIPLGRFATAQEVAAAIAYLCSDHAVSITGAVLNISGGMVLD